MNANISALVFLGGVLFLVVELLKRTLKSEFSLSDARSQWVVLFFSMVLGVAGVVLLFPGANQFVGQGASPLAEQFATGILVAGSANGINFLSGIGTAGAVRAGLVSPQKAA